MNVHKIGISMYSSFYECAHVHVSIYPTNISVYRKHVRMSTTNTIIFAAILLLNVCEVFLFFFIYI